MRLILALGALAMTALLSGCGGDKALKVDCDEPQRYQSARLGPGIRVPEGLDPLNEFNEMPIPQADPDAPQPPEGKCVDMPPMTGTS
jgi:uncharacterized lipoprotein